MLIGIKPVESAVPTERRQQVCIRVEYKLWAVQAASLIEGIDEELPLLQLKAHLDTPVLALLLALEF